MMMMNEPGDDGRILINFHHTIIRFNVINTSFIHVL